MKKRGVVDQLLFNAVLNSDIIAIRHGQDMSRHMTPWRQKRCISYHSSIESSAKSWDIGADHYEEAEEVPNISSLSLYRDT